MTSTQQKFRTYVRQQSVVFLKTKEAFGGLSNMAAGFPICVEGVRILTSEALYQACRFPHLPEVQNLIIEQRSPMTAKMKSKPYRQYSRSDWDHVRVKIMRWCLRVKLAQNLRKFGELLLETGDRPIVEESRKDDFWGARPIDERNLVGMNALGRLLMELREGVRAGNLDSLLRVEPLAIPDFLLGGRPVAIVTAPGAELPTVIVPPVTHVSSEDVGSGAFAQQTLFDVPVVNESPRPYPIVTEEGARVADLKPYPEYKESGLPWLGRVPRHWSFERTKWRFQNRKQLNTTGDQTNVLSLTLRGVVNNNPDDPEGLVPKDYRTYQFFAKGDLVFKLIDLENLRTSRVGLVHEDGIMSSAYVRLAPSGPTNIRYFYHQFYDLYSRGIYNQLGGGVRSTLGPSDLLNVGIAIPPPLEQAAIVRFVDWANGRLERAIRAKRKVIALLNEQKQAIIHGAVTRGLDSSVALKPSGIPWLGDIPQHWEVRRLKSLVKEAVAGPFGSSLTKSMYTQSGYRVYGQQQVIPDNFTLGDYYISKAQFEDMRKYRVSPGDVLVSVIGTVGRVAVVPENAEPGIINPRLVRYRTDAAAVQSRWMQLVMQDRIAQAQISEASKGTTMDTLNMRSLGKLLLLIPPSVEQDAILELVSRERQPFTSAISRLEREIDLLREYRIRLVADVVTGKLDVREVAARLPDEGAPDIVGGTVDVVDEVESIERETSDG